jgi:rod shape-determining protein MreD
MREGIFLFLLAFAFLPAVTVWPREPFGPGMKPDPALILVVWAAIRFDSDAAIVFGFLLGLMTDLLSGAPTGLLGILYCIVAASTKYAIASVTVEGHTVRAILVLFATLLTGYCVLTVRWLNGATGFGSYTVGVLLVKSVLTAGVSVILIPLTDRLWRAYDSVAAGR